MAGEGSVEVLTFGCRLNVYESEVMLRHAREAGASNVVIVNSCAVTAEAERQVRQAIRRAKRERPEAEIVVTGCAAQLSPETFAAMPEVGRVLGNSEKMDAANWRPGESDEKVRVTDIQQVREATGHLVSPFASRTRAFLQVQNGCDHRCTFCIIPFARGPARSVPVADVVAQIRQLAGSGTGEVVLSGVDLTSYGQDLSEGVTLGVLVRQILREVPELRRLRLSSVDPVEIDEDLWGAIANEERLMPHFHLSLQAGDDMILKRMKRRHSRREAAATASRIRQLRPAAVLGADLIAGFPTESAAQFQNSLDLVEECGLTHLHVFPYSERPGTPAARIPSLPMEVRRERAARLRRAGETALYRHLRGKIGTVEEVLVEARGRALTADFSRVRLADAPPPGTFQNARFLRVANLMLEAS